MAHLVYLLPSGVRAIRILVVEDDARVREVLALLLVSLGHEVIESPNGSDALSRLERGESVDLVLTDLMMPGIPGWVLARTIRRRWPSLRVGLVSGDLVTLRRHEQDADFVIAKPVDRQALAERLRALGLP